MSGARSGSPRAEIKNLPFWPASTGSKSKSFRDFVLHMRFSVWAGSARVFILPPTHHVPVRETQDLGAISSVCPELPIAVLVLKPVCCILREVVFGTTSSYIHALLYPYTYIDQGCQQTPTSPSSGKLLLRHPRFSGRMSPLAPLGEFVVLGESSLHSAWNPKTTELGKRGFHLFGETEL